MACNTFIYHVLFLTWKYLKDSHMSSHVSHTKGRRNRSNSPVPSGGQQVLLALKVQHSITALMQEQDLRSSQQCGYKP